VLAVQGRLNLFTISESLAVVPDVNIIPFEFANLRSGTAKILLILLGVIHTIVSRASDALFAGAKKYGPSQE
jgi:hypothetical protein